MPELPEVQTVVNYLEPEVQGKFINSIDSPNNYLKVFGNENLSFVKNAIRGKRIVRLGRRGKYIIIHLNKGHLILHLRMTGKLLLQPLQKKFDKHLSFRINFND